MKIYKITLLIIVQLLPLLGALAQNHFIPVESTGLPYHVIISEISVNSSSPSLPFEIGIFDDSLCVGAIQVDANSDSVMDVVTWQENETFGLPGYSEGDSIRILIWFQYYGEWTEAELQMIFSVGNGTFGFGSYSVVELSLQTGDYPHLEVFPDQLNFGTVLVGDSSVKEVNLTNSGTLNVTLSLLETDNISFLIGNFNNTILPGDTQRIPITFLPTDDIHYIGSLSIHSDAQESPVTVPLTGQGITPGYPEIILLPDSINFGLVELSDSSMATVSIQNNGSDTLHISEINLNNDNFLLINPGLSIIPPGGNENLVIRFKPLISGKQETYLYIFSDALNNPNATVFLQGYGYSGFFNPVNPTGLPYMLIIDSLYIDECVPDTDVQIGIFDDLLCVGVGVFEGIFPVTITCWEGIPAQNIQGFQIGDSIEYRFYASLYDSNITIHPYPEYLSGEGTFGSGEFSVVRLTAYSNIQPSIEISTQEIEFPPTIINSSCRDSFYIYNSGLTPLQVNSITPDNQHFWAIPENTYIMPQESLEVALFFQPVDIIPYEGTLSIFSNDPFQPQVLISLFGVGLSEEQSILEVISDSVDFAATPVGDTSTVQIFLRNLGNSNISVISVNSTNPDFYYPGEQFTISPGQIFSMPIKFIPSSQGYVSGELTINNTSQNLPHASIYLTGFGYESFFRTVSPTGLPYTILIDTIHSNTGFDIQEGDQIGVFDGSICTGLAIVGYPYIISLDSSSIDSSQNINAVAVAWEENNDAGLPGFSIGDSIKFRYHPANGDSQQVYDIIPESILGDGTYGFEPYSLVSLTITDNLITPSIIQHLPDFTFHEDCGLDTISLNLYEYFYHPYDSLNFYWSLIDTTILIQHTFQGENFIFETLPDSNGLVRVCITASDGYSSVKDTFKIAINPINDPPEITSDFPVPIQFQEDDTLYLNLNNYVVDIDNNPEELNWHISIMNNEARIIHKQSFITDVDFLRKSKTSNIDYPLYELEDSITIEIDTFNIATIFAVKDFSIDSLAVLVIVNDSIDSDTFGTDTLLSYLKILPVNDPPVLDSIPIIEMVEDSVKIIQFSEYLQYVEDSDTPDSLFTWHIGEFRHISVYLASDSAILSPDSNFYGLDTALIFVSDQFLSDSVEVLVYVSPINDPPSFLSDSLNISGTAVVGHAYSDTLFAFDIDDNILYYSLFGSPDSMQIGLNSGIINFIPEISDTGKWEIIAIVSDTSGLSDSLRFSLIVLDSFTLDIQKDKIPFIYSFNQNYPNPFNTRTVINYSVPELSKISIIVYDILGKEVYHAFMQREHHPGYYQFVWDGTNDKNKPVSSGIYLILFSTEKYKKCIKTMLLR